MHDADLKVTIIILLKMHAWWMIGNRTGDGKKKLILNIVYKFNEQNHINFLGLIKENP